jgi:hypothetical protein
MDPVARRVVDALPELSAHGGQLHLQRGSASTGLTFGEALVGEPLTDEHVFNVYCAAKPVAVMATLAALEDAGVASAPSTPLPELLALPGASPFGRLTLGDLVGHRAGLAVPDVFKFVMASDQSRGLMLERIDRSLARRRPRAEHSTLALSYVLTVLLRRMVGATLGEVLDHHLGKVGLTRTFVRVPEGAAPIGVFVDRTRGRYVPMLHERLPHFCDSPYGELVGLYTTAGDLGAWGAELLAVLRGEARAGFPRTATVAAYRAEGATRLDGAGADEPAFAAGLAIGLPAHGLVQAPVTAFGQFGFVRSSLLYLDPATDTVLAGIVTDLSLDDLDRRLAQWDAALGELGAPGGGGAA